MTNKAPVFFVTEVEYPKLQAACPSDFPFIYAQFVERVEDVITKIKGTKNKGDKNKGDRFIFFFARVVAAKYPHHVTRRGNRRQDTFFCEEDELLIHRMSRRAGRWGIFILLSGWGVS
ncbi:MAG: hypothetical protein WAW31_12925 [Smithella sp.]